MNILHLHPEDYQTTRWSGGTTTQLFLYPQQGSYTVRDFRFRISSATVEQLDSDFTPLSGIERWITPVEGSFLLTHPDASPKQMGPLSAPYRFWGQQPTHCHGKARDFNLMLQDCKGNMEICRGNASVRPGFNGFYPIEDSFFK